MRALVLCAVSLVLSAPSFASADDGCACRTRKARAALALAAAKSPVPVAVAPMPRAKCSCGEPCACPTGACPTCPLAQPAAAPVAPQAKAETYRYEQRCQGGKCYWVLVKE